MNNVGFEAYFKEMISKLLKENNELFMPILKDMKKASKVKEVTIVHEGQRYISKETAAYLIDVSKSLIDKKVEEKKLKKYYLDGLKTPRYLESEVLNLIKDKPVSVETRKPGRINKKGARLAQNS